MDFLFVDVIFYVFCYSFVSIVNDFGFMEIIIVVFVGYVKGFVMSNYIYIVDMVFIMVVDMIVGYIQGLFDGIEFKQIVYVLDWDFWKMLFVCFFQKVVGNDDRIVDVVQFLVV